MDLLYDWKEKNMADFYINTETVSRQTTRITNVSDTVKNVKGMVGNVSSGLAGIGLGQVVPTINALEQRLARHVGITQNLSSSLSQIVIKYIAAESDILGIPLAMNPAYQSVASTYFENTAYHYVGSNIPAFRLLRTVKDFGSKLLEGDITETKIQNFILPFLQEKTIKYADGKEIKYGINPDCIKDVIKEVTKDKKVDDWAEAHKKKTKDIVPEDRKLSQAKTVPLLHADIGKDYSVWDSGKGELKGKYGSLEGQAKALNAGWGASAYAGIFSEDGKFAPGVGAKIGGSASLFEANGTARLGNDYYGVYAKGGVEVMKASAEASISAGLYDEDGKVNPSFGLGGEAELIVGKAEGSVGHRVLGTDVGVSGEIGFGLGAHADIGFQEGKFKFDVGAYVGVGAGVSIELDFSDTYDTMVSAWNDAKDLAGDIYDGAKDFVGDVADGAGKVWDAITFWD